MSVLRIPTQQFDTLPKPRLLPDVVSEKASQTPDHVWASIPWSAADVSEGYEDITFKRLAHAVDRAAWWLHENMEPIQQRPHETLAYLGPPDSRYMILTLASIKAGFQLLFLSPRNSDEAQYHIMAEAECTVFLCAEQFKERVTSLFSRRPQPATDASPNKAESIFVVPEERELLNEEPRIPFPYEKTVEDARFEPLVSIHTSSTTGMPKLVRLNQGYGFHEDISRHYPKESGLDLITRKPFYGHCRLFLAFPLFHAGGVLLGLLKALYHDIILVFQPPLSPTSASTVDAVLRIGKCTGCVIPPFLVEEMLPNQSYFNTLSGLSFVQFGSGPMSKAAGDLLLTRQQNCPHYIGTTEIGLLPCLELDDPVEDWQYFNFHPWSGLEMRPLQGNDKLFELVIMRLPGNAIGLQPVFELFPNKQEWATGDVYSKHPTRANLWRTAGRLDDVLVLSTGEKLNPVDTESSITAGHPAVTGSLVIGQGRFQPGLLLEVVGIDVHDENKKRQLVEEIWPIVSRTNDKAPKHGQLTKSLILFSSPEKPFLRTPKLSVRRNPTISLYAKEIDDIYRLVEEDLGSLENHDVPDEIDLQSEQSIQDTMGRLIMRICGWPQELDPEADLFVLGIDSLHVVRIVRAIRYMCGTIPEARSLGAIGPKFVYEHPSLTSLSSGLYHNMFPGAASDIENGVQHPKSEQVSKRDNIQEIIDKWSAGLPGPELKISHSGKSGFWTVILTGSTGSMGSYLLEKLVVHPKVAKVICFNRSPDAAKKWKDSTHNRKTSKTQCPIEFLQTTNIGAPFFNLTEQEYKGLCQEVTHIVHNAWPVNFNLSVESFEKVHIAGVRRFIDFSSESTNDAKIYYVSSLSSVTSAAGHASERVVYDNTLPAHMGYGQSKFISECLLDAASVSSNGRVFSTIFRVGQIAGPVSEDDDGVWNPQEWFPSILTSSHTLGALPQTLGRMDGVEWIPVDVLADIMVEIMVSEDEEIHSKAEVYHLHNPTRVHWSDFLLPAAKKHLHISKTLSLEEWTKTVETGPEADDKSRPNPARKIVDYYRSLSTGDDEHQRPLVQLKATTKSQTLQNMGPVTTDWLRKWLSDLQF
ncbi:hypothetical protein FE257_005903 [Aspergillus nanangensis]|uniref:Carrier domain-containing protein n=1 Tax=Aspergillus nanangensis TaxID=2582783 RepID=A0AAD4CQE5_ASPNN|nr:hypothetical protein FE257_005903 [Aspergillus nanangensis]